MVKKKKSEFVNRLYEIAQSQNGYFTASQAEAAGYKRQNFKYMVINKSWARIKRGIYRLSNFPVSEYEQYIIYSLFVGLKENKPIGVYSHLTALGFYDISEVMAGKLHMTVPTSYRIRKEFPKNFIFYRENLKEDEVKDFAGFRMTTVKKTLLDLARNEMMERDHFAESVIQAYDKGYISRAYILKNSEFQIIHQYLEDKLF